MTFPRNLSLAALAALLICATPSWGADKLFGDGSPLLKFVDFITGPFAYAVVIIALVVTVGILAIGGEFSGFSRRMPIIVIAGGIVILSGKVITNLFGKDRAADLPPFSLSPPAVWSDPAPSDPTRSDPSGVPAPQPARGQPKQTIAEDQP